MKILRLLVTKKWVLRDNMVWIKNCPLPKYEVFKRHYETTFE